MKRQKDFGRGNEESEKIAGRIRKGDKRCIAAKFCRLTRIGIWGEGISLGHDL